MRALILSAVLSLGLALAMWPENGQTQTHRDFVFADLEGHLIIRFAGIGAGGLSPAQVEEVSNSEFSSMVHDRMHADLVFEAERRDPAWAATMEPQIAEHMKHAGPEFSGVHAECRAESCRVIMEQTRHWTVPEHRAVLETVQKSVEAFIASHPQDFGRTFMLAAYYQEYETPQIKAFLQRTGPASHGE